jgi:hypothetical protein
MADQPDRRFRPPTTTVVYVALGVPAPGSRELICNRCHVRRDIGRFNYAASASIANAYWLPCLDCSDWDGLNRDYGIAAAIERQEHPESDVGGGYMVWPVQTDGQMRLAGEGAANMNGRHGSTSGAASAEPAVGNEMSDLTESITSIEQRQDDDSDGDIDEGIQNLEDAERSDDEFVAAHSYLSTNPLPIPTQSDSFFDHEPQLPPVPQNSPDTVDLLPTDAPLPTRFLSQPELQSPARGRVLNTAAATFQVRQIATPHSNSRSSRQANRRAYFQALRQGSNQTPGPSYNGYFPGIVPGPLAAFVHSTMPGTMTAPRGQLYDQLDPNGSAQPPNLPQRLPLNMPPVRSTSQPTTQPTRAQPFLFPPPSINTGPRPQGQSLELAQVVSGSGFMPDRAVDMIDSRNISEPGPHQVEALTASTIEISPAPPRQVQVSQPLQAPQAPRMPTLAPLDAGARASVLVDAQPPSTSGQRSHDHVGLGASVTDTRETLDEGEPAEEVANEEDASGAGTA